MLLNIDSISKSYGARTLFSNATFHVNERDRTALVGANGAGKTTLLNIIAHRDAPDEGTISLAKDATIG
jgi:ATP-binding cassette subfamily F protein 3